MSTLVHYIDALLFYTNHAPTHSKFNKAKNVLNDNSSIFHLSWTVQTSSKNDSATMKQSKGLFVKKKSAISFVARGCKSMPALELKRKETQFL